MSTATYTQTMPVHVGPHVQSLHLNPVSQAVGAPKVSDLVRVLDPSTPVPYVPSHSLPTPPISSQARENYDKSSPALAQVTDETLEQVLQRGLATRSVAGDESAFFACDLSAVYEAVQLWRNSAIGSRVEIFYAVKCNPSPVILHFLSLLGMSFDCASSAEINQVLSLPTAPRPDRIIFANPCKPASFVRAAQQTGVDMMTFDNADELHKIKRFHPNAKLVLRMLTDDSKSLCRLGLKFGAPLSTCPGLLALAKQLGLNVIGVSFHVGSGCKDPLQFADAVWRARRVFDMGKEVGYDFQFLDVGGGFERETFHEMSQVVKDSLDLYFPEEEGVRVVAEPGRFLVSSGTSSNSVRLPQATQADIAVAFTLVTNIIAQRRALDGAAPSAEQHDEGEGADVMCKWTLSRHLMSC